MLSTEDLYHFELHMIFSAKVLSPYTLKMGLCIEKPGKSEEKSRLLNQRIASLHYGRKNRQI